MPRDVVRLLAGLGHAAAEDLLDVAGLDARLLHQALLESPQELAGVEAGEVAAAQLASGEGGAQRFDDDGLGHGGISSCFESVGDRQAGRVARSGMGGRILAPGPRFA